MITISVYLQDGRIFEYEVANETKGREHAHRIGTLGWRNWEDGNECYYPAHQIRKVTFPAKLADQIDDIAVFGRLRRRKHCPDEWRSCNSYVKGEIK